ncbi:hypothetical protein PHMEG_0008255 [Phytophthora megakarya]|uniref:RUN domain-containing protein n=1 Tax=Phytophthora megakarya TaxID=4795 RepID=A0A225WJG3_9STRA|nr:hypothetical protein PHMEG_0008255 [Phytophthora megakarya]
MAPDLEAGTFRGLAALARNWNAFTLFFQDVQIRLGRLDEIAENSLVATTTTSITITRNSLCYIFPHLMRHGLDRGEGGNQWSHIASSLLNRRIVMSGSVHFNWDSANKRVVGLFTQADMVSPLLHLLGSLEDISRIFTNALIDPECNLIDMKYLDKYKVW